LSENNGTKILEVTARLQNFDTERKSRSSAILKWAVSAARGLKEAFDEYIYKEIVDMKDILNMLQSVQQEVDDERAELKRVELEYYKINDKLNILLESANRNKIKRIDFTKRVGNYQTPYPPMQQSLELDTIENNNLEEEQLDIVLILEAFEIIGEVEELRKKVDRVARNYRRMITNMESVFDEFLKRRGLDGNT
jgi:hypothetical protein